MRGEMGRHPGFLSLEGFHKACRCLVAFEGGRARPRVRCSAPPPNTCRVKPRPHPCLIRFIRGQTLVSSHSHRAGAKDGGGHKTHDFAAEAGAAFSRASTSTYKLVQAGTSKTTPLFFNFYADRMNRMDRMLLRNLIVREFSYPVHPVNSVQTSFLNPPDQVQSRGHGVLATLRLRCSRRRPAQDRGMIESWQLEANWTMC